MGLRLFLGESSCSGRARFGNECALWGGRVVFAVGFVEVREGRNILK